MQLELPDLSLVVLVGASGSGKSSFAARHFLPTEVVSSDACRAMICDDPNDMTSTHGAFSLLNEIAGRRLSTGKLTVVDATSVRKDDRKELLQLARRHDVLTVAVVFDLPTKLCVSRDAERGQVAPTTGARRAVGPQVIRRQQAALRRDLRGLRKEGFHSVYKFKTAEEVDSAELRRVPLWCNRQQELGPFDIVGDVHGCYAELVQLLGKLGYEVTQLADGFSVTNPAGRRLIFLGDLVDRGPASPQVLKLVMHLVGTGQALCVPGNHDVKLTRFLQGKQVKLRHGLEQTAEQLATESDVFKQHVLTFVQQLVSHQVLDGGKLVVAHAGMKQAFQGRASGRVREFALYGETTGEVDSFGLPERVDWAQDYRGDAMVVYGHTPVPRAEWINRTICIDTGCVFGGSLTALRYPERELVSVRAAQVYYEPTRPLEPTREERPERVLDLSDLFEPDHKRSKPVSTEFGFSVSAGRAQVAQALEEISRFTIDPRWLIYLPPTMSPCEAASDGPLLEAPAQAFDYFRREGVTHVVCQEKHMGSRAIVVLCRNAETARQRFGADSPSLGVVYSRSGRSFFKHTETEQALLERLRQAAEGCGLWQRFDTEWLCLDCEILPWTHKAKELVRDQYAAVGCAGEAALAAMNARLGQAAARLGQLSAADAPEREHGTSGSLLDLQAAVAHFAARERSVAGFRAAYRQYCWPSAGLEGLEVAPFHLLATEGQVHSDKSHVWHMRVLGELVDAAPKLLRRTPYRVVELTPDEEAADLTPQPHPDLSDVETVSEADASAWWAELTSVGGEGMVIKPLHWLSKRGADYVQPALKCRGPEYLRIIYGPEYLLPQNLERMRGRRLRHKRGLALRESALGLEALGRFARREPLHRVHECVFTLLALECERTDPRL
ncbi:MAG: polynucleotide kinase-phosphatase [Polyangiaceae bacterium]